MSAARRSRATRDASAGSGRPGRGGLKGRHWVAIWLAAFLTVALIVVWRQSAALRTYRELQTLQKVRSTLEVSKSTRLGEISRARSRAVMVPLAEQKLGLRLPQDSEITILQDSRPR